MTSPQRTVAVIGAGPAGLMAAEVASRAGLSVTVIERMAAPARKFLLAGRGGLNLTHTEGMERFLPRYGATDERLKRAIEAFPGGAVVTWANELGQETFIGTSGRVFPKAMKASPLLRAWLARLAEQGVTLRLGTDWRGVTADGTVQLVHAGVSMQEKFDAVILALGGASWPRLGADGSWVPVLTAAGIPVSPLTPANAGVLIDWTEVHRTRFAGEPLKRIALTVGNTHVRGEAMITRDGLEGGVIYAATEVIRQALAQDGTAAVSLDLRPDMTLPELTASLASGPAPTKQSLANMLRRVRLAPAAASVLREGGAALPREAHALAARIKAVPLTVTDFAGMARAISSAGGVAFDGLDEHWMLRARPGVFVAGEMVDWSAPTGGYLLTACLATGRAAAIGVVRWLR
jgi:uncharacterized flavoprotein (TIGR03862 family)